MNLHQHHNNQSVPLSVDEGIKSHEMKLEVEPVAHNQMVDDRKSMPFEIAPKETETYLTWEEAMFYCQFLNYDGGGWRLPSKEELNLMYLTKTDEMDYEESWYLSSTEGNGLLAWTQYFSNGYQVNSNKNTSFYVRAVRSF